MDGNKDNPREGEEQSERQHLTYSTSKPREEPNIRRSTSVSSLDSQDSALGTDADDPPSSDMDSAGDAYRRRRAQLMAGLENGSAKGKNSRGKYPRRPRHASGALDDKHRTSPSGDEEGSDFSSNSTSDDVELSHLASEDALTDDEETGLTRKDKEHRKRKRRRNTRLDGRIAGNTKSLKQEQKDADRNVIKAMIINVVLIVLWYIFSLSISIVGQNA